MGPLQSQGANGFAPNRVYVDVLVPLQPKQYVAGSQRDEGSNSNTIALVAAGVGVSILVVGLISLRGEKPAASGI